MCNTPFSLGDLDKWYILIAALHHIVIKDTVAVTLFFIDLTEDEIIFRKVWLDQANCGQILIEILQNYCTDIWFELRN